jgi:hypothetical protein
LNDAVVIGNRIAHWQLVIGCDDFVLMIGNEVLAHFPEQWTPFQSPIQGGTLESDFVHNVREFMPRHDNTLLSVAFENFV